MEEDLKTSQVTMYTQVILFISNYILYIEIL